MREFDNSQVPLQALHIIIGTLMVVGGGGVSPMSPVDFKIRQCHYF